MDFVRAVRKNDVEDMVSLVGPISKGQIPSLYNKIDFVFLLSKLESFSNNIIEAWHYKRPLIIAREDWAISLCGKSAFYVDRDDITQIADAIEYLIAKPELMSYLTSQGASELKSYPTIFEKLALELNYIEEIYEMH